MIGVLCFLDEKDGKLGAYFQKGADDLSSLVDSLDDIELQGCLGTKYCTFDNVCEQMKSLHNKSICVMYSHGNSDEFLANGKSYINLANSKLFKDTFIYSTACLTAHSLGLQLISDGCLAFVGFTKESGVLLDENYEKIILNCDQACLYAFLSHDITLEDAFQLALSYYDTEIAKCNKMEDIILRGILVNNREALVIYGDNALTKSSLSY